MPFYERESKGDYDFVTPLGAPSPPSLGELPELTADRLEKRFTLLEQFDRDLAKVERSGAIERIDGLKQKAFSLLSSSKTRNAFDISQESEATRAEYGSSLWGSSVSDRPTVGGSRFNVRDGELGSETRQPLGLARE